MKLGMLRQHLAQQGRTRARQSGHADKIRSHRAHSEWRNVARIIACLLFLVILGAR
jgi:hypothetical protein